MAELKLVVGADVKEAEQALRSLVTNIDQTSVSIKKFSTDVSVFGRLPLHSIDNIRKSFLDLKKDLSNVKFAAIPPVTADTRPAQLALKQLTDEVKKTVLSVPLISASFDKFSSDVNKSLGALSTASLENFKRAFISFKQDLSNVKISALPPVTIDTQVARIALRNFAANVDTTLDGIRADLSNLKVAAIQPVNINTAPAEASLKALVSTVNTTVVSFRQIGSDINKSFSALPFNIEKFRTAFINFKADLSDVKIAQIPPVTIDTRPAETSLKNLTVNVDKTVDAIKADLSNVKISTLPPIGVDIRPAQASLRNLVDEAKLTGTSISGISTDVERFSASVRKSLGALPLHNVEAFRQAFLSFKADLSGITIAKIPPIKVDVGFAQQSLQKLSQEAEKTGVSVSNVAASFQRFSQNISRSFGALPLASIAAFRDAFQDFKSDLTNVKITAIPPIHVDTTQAQTSLKALTEESKRSATGVTALEAQYARWAALAAASGGKVSNALIEVNRGLSAVDATAQKTFLSVVGSVDQAGTAVKRFGVVLNTSLGTLPLHNVSAFRKTFLDFKSDLSNIKVDKLPAIDINISPAIQKLRALGEDAQKTGSLIRNSLGNISLAPIDKFRKAFLALDLEKVKFTPISPQFGSSVTSATRSLNKIPGASQAATLSLLNLGRVVQDAPFGFLGIANNLNPLLESFQRLKATTGTTGGALKSLGKSLMGAGGLGFALSIASSLLIVFGDKLFGIGGKADKTNEEIEETTRRLKDLLRPLSQVSSAAIAGTTEELTKVSVLSKAVLDQTKSYEQRNNALNQLKTINQSYFGDLTLETAKLGLLKERVDEYTKAIIAQAVVKGFSDEIGKLAVELNTQERAFNDAGKSVDKFNKILANTKETKISLTGEERISQEFVDAKKDAKGATKAFDDQAKTVGDLRNRMFELRNAITAAVESTLDFRPLEIKTPTGGDKAADKLREFIEKAKRLNAELEKIGFIAPVQFSFFDSFEEELAKAKKVFDDFNSKNLKIDPKVFTFPSFSEPQIKKEVDRGMDVVREGIRSGIIGLPPIPLNVDLEANIVTNFSQNAELIRDFTKLFQNIGQGIPKINLDDFAGFNEGLLLDKLRNFFKVSSDVTKDGLAVLVADFSAGIKRINDILSNLQFEGLVTIGEALGTVLAGGDVKEAFKAFGNVIASGLTAIGKELIVMSGVIKSVKLALTTAGLNPALLLAGGVALIAIGAALRASLNKGVSGFAQGGLVFGPTLGLIGEGVGTSRSNPEVIAPLDQLKKMLGDTGASRLQPIVLRTAVRGDNLLLIQHRTTRRQGRTR